MMAEVKDYEINIAATSDDCIRSRHSAIAVNNGLCYDQTHWLLCAESALIGLNLFKSYKALCLILKTEQYSHQIPHKSLAKAIYDEYCLGQFGMTATVLLQYHNSLK